MRVLSDLLKICHAARSPSGCLLITLIWYFRRFLGSCWACYSLDEYLSLTSNVTPWGHHTPRLGFSSISKLQGTTINGDRWSSPQSSDILSALRPSDSLLREVYRSSTASDDSISRICRFRLGSVQASPDCSVFDRDIVAQSIWTTQCSGSIARSTGTVSSRWTCPPAQSRSAWSEIHSPYRCSAKRLSACPCFRESSTCWTSSCMRSCHPF